MTDLRVEAVGPDERDVLARLLELYSHDFRADRGRRRRRRDVRLAPPPVQRFRIDA